MPIPTFPLGALLAAPPSQSALQVRLFSGPALGALPVLLADVVECAFPGYAPVGLGHWQDADVVDEKVVSRRCKNALFTCTGPAAGMQALGYFVTAFDGTQAVLVDIQEFDAPRPLDAAGKNVSLDVEVTGFDNALFS